MLWFPLHCGQEGNERADVLVDEGTKISQENVPVSEAIIEAKIKARNWQPEHQRSVEKFRNRKTPKKRNRVQMSQESANSIGNFENGACEGALAVKITYR